MATILTLYSHNSEIKEDPWKNERQKIHTK